MSNDQRLATHVQKNNSGDIKSDQSQIAPPAISIPKGGGAIRGIDEKFSVNPATGTGSLSIPIFTSPGRQGFSPQLALSYDSGAGNGPFGFGWNLSIPTITRKTDKGLPRYRDAEASDTFILSGAEDLVPALLQSGDTWERDTLARTVGVDSYIVQRYRPRIEGLFARIERWEHQTSGDVHWQSVTKENVTSIYGQSPAARISDPDDAGRVFSWLLEESYDDKGNVIRYEYKRENQENVDPSLPQEKNRLANNRSYANQYLKRIKYGNQTPYERDGWLFEIVFDYGEHDPQNPTPAERQAWPIRPDAFSSFRASFEIRTQRLCQRVLMFHHFAELGDTPHLVRSTDFDYDEGPVASFLLSTTQTGYKKQDDGPGYHKKSLPPLEFTYSEAKIDETVHFVAADSLENLPSGLDGGRYQWVDLDGEGVSGILAEQGEGWFYKRNLGDTQFAPTQLLATQPSVANLQSAQQQVMDLAGDGQKDLVLLSKPVTGFYERGQQEDWLTFIPFTSVPQVNWQNPNLRLIDLNGDGHADILISEDEVFTWYPSQAEAGFGLPEVVRKMADEEQGPSLVFADATQSIYLADMTGDGLVDIARIRNGQVCYWPNMGYGRFGAKVTMADAPLFDHPDQFQQHRIRLADIDGSGTTDIIYLGQDGAKIWFNQTGNSWSAVRQLSTFPTLVDPATVTVVDLLGNGTACLVWSSPLPADAHQPLRYIDLMGGTKPHLLTTIRNNMGLERKLQYAPSTRFYLDDKAAGKPWLTKLHFPVHVLDQVEVVDVIAETRLVTRYAYHHGYFDGQEREFRGFGLVEQWGAESFADDEPGETLDLPPVYTKTWFHTGAYLDREHISQQFTEEYYKCDPEAAFLPDTQLPASLGAEEERQACRALKGRTLRQEVYAEDGTPEQDHPYLVTEQAYELRLVQPQQDNPHAVFYAYGSETLSYHYERNPADPRIGHQMTLEVDAFGNVRKSAAIGYPRRPPQSEQPAHPAEQRQILMTYTEVDVFNKPAAEDVVNNSGDEVDWYRIGIPLETRTYELTGVVDVNDLLVPLSVNEVFEAAQSATGISYEKSPSSDVTQKRLLNHTRTLYYRNDLSGPLPLGAVESLALPYETYRLAFTSDLLTTIFNSRINEDLLRDEAKYLKGADYKAQGLFPAEDAAGDWWTPSGRYVYPSLPEARAHFYLSNGFQDPFGQTTAVAHDGYDLLLVRTEDPLLNIVQAENDYRMMQPVLITDPNGNQSQVAFDTLGMVVGTAVMGKDGENKGDSLVGFEPDLDETILLDHLNDPLDQPEAILTGATTRLVYDLERYQREGQPVVVYTLARETHVSDLAPGESSKVQHSFLYSDGSGREVMTKVQAEPGPAPERDPVTGEVMVVNGEVQMVEVARRWVGTGRTIYDNKGNPVKQYEPFFSDTHTYETEQAVVNWGVTPILTYDPLGRLIRTDYPNSTFNRVDFDPWQQATWDANDTVLESGWYSDRGRPDPQTEPEPTDPERRAAWLAAEHANTPSVQHLDSLGRPFLSITHNREVRRDDLGRITATIETHIPTRSTLNIEGQPAAIRDGRGIEGQPNADPLTYLGGNEVMTYSYGMGGLQLYQNSMDAGERWSLNNVAGNPIRAWDSRGFTRRLVYDELQRPTEFFVQSDGQAEILVERTVYGEQQPSPETHNLRRQVYQQFDGAGLVTSHEFDFKGNLLRGSRQLAQEYRQTLDWAGSVPLEAEIFEQLTAYDALNRPISLTMPDNSEIQPIYNEANLLEQVQVRLRGTAAWTLIVNNIDYNAKGQRKKIEYGNGVTTTYDYDPLTFRLINLRSVRGSDGATLQDLSYTYDPTGNITEIRDEAQQTVFFDNSSVSPHASYTYDALYQLIAASGREHIGQTTQVDHNDPLKLDIPHPNNPEAMRRYTEQYEYDEVGNILKMIHQATGGNWTRTYTYTQPSLIEPGKTNNRLSTTVVGNTTVGYNYDEHGNMTAMPHLPNIKWDFKDQMVEVDLGGGGTAYYVYNSAGQRVRKIHEHNGTTFEERIYLGGFEIYRKQVAGGLKLERETLHIMDDQKRIALVETKTQDEGTPISSPTSWLRFQLSNHLDSVSLEVDETGAVISYEEYHPFGTTAYRAAASSLEVSEIRYRYTAKEKDEETGLYYHEARYYACWLGRWVSTDPIGIDGGINFFRYVKNNPIRFIDPLGAAPEDTEQTDNDTGELRIEVRRPTRRDKRFQKKMGKIFGSERKDGGSGPYDLVGGEWVISEKEKRKTERKTKKFIRTSIFKKVFTPEKAKETERERSNLIIRDLPTVSADLPEMTPIMIATQLNNAEFIDWLAQKGADPNIIADESFTAGDIALKNEFPDLWDKLQSHGFKPKYNNLLMAMFGTSVELLDRVIGDLEKHGKDPKDAFDEEEIINILEQRNTSILGLMEGADDVSSYIGLTPEEIETQRKSNPNFIKADKIREVMRRIIEFYGVEYEVF